MSRRTTLLVLAAGLAAVVPAGAATAAPSMTTASPIVSSTAADSALGDRLSKAPETLRTPFEVSGGTQWSTYEEWRDFWSQLAADNDRVSFSEVGRSGQDRPIDLVVLGAPAPRSQERAAEGSVVLFNCSIHGDEPSGREACMVLGRDLATSQDPQVKRFLRDTTVLFVDINPDGWVADTRENAAGVDVNRDFLALETSEARVLAQLIRDWKPDVLNDLHEYGPREFYDAQATTLWPRNRNVDDGVQALAKEMVTDYTGATIVAAGMSNAIYGHLNKDGRPFRQIAGDDQARILRNYSGLRHVVGQLTEAANAPVTDAEKNNEVLTNKRRVAVQYASAVGSAALVLERREEIAETIEKADATATRMGAAREGVVYFAGQDDMLPTLEKEVEPNPMCGYQLSAAQVADLGPKLDLHGVKVESNGWVPMGQSMRGLIPLLLDERSEYRIATVPPVAECPA